MQFRLLCVHQNQCVALLDLPDRNWKMSNCIEYRFSDDDVLENWHC